MMLSIFISYAHRDEPLLKELEEHLALLQNQGVITTWHDRDISAGAEWEHEIDTHLDAAHIILLLISASFLASKYCYSTEMKRAMERHKGGEAWVIPVILRPVDWKGAPFGRLQALPTKARPITSWSDQDEAFLDVAKGIRDAIKRLMIQSQPRKIALFGYETQGGNSSILWSDPDTFSLNETYQEWSETKRDVTEREIVDHIWVKAGDSGNFSTFHFLPHGLLYESPLLDSTERLQGSWKLINGVLRTNIEQYEGDTLAKYELDIFASKNDLVHSGIESRNAQATYAYFTLFPSQQAAKRLEEALTAYNQLLCVNQNCAEAYKAKGNILRDLRRYEEALDAYQRAIELKPDYMWAWYDKGDILRKLKRYEEAVAAFDHAIELDDRNAWAWFEKGQNFYDLERYKEALTLYERAIEIDTKHAWFWHRKGETLHELEQYTEALISYEQALKVDPKFAKSYNGKGNVLYRNLKRYEEAIAAYRQATELEPNYMWAWHNLGNVLHELRRFKAALIAYRRTTEIDSSYFWAWQNMGDVLHELGQLEEALVAFDQAINRDEHVAVTWREKGKTLQDLERYEEALASYERALELDSQYPSIWTRRGQVLRMLKRYEEAITAYDEALKLETNYVDAYLGKGRVYLDLARYSEALDVYEQATNIAPNNTWTWHDKGEALSRLGRTADALMAFEKAIALDATNKWAWRHKSTILGQLAKQAAQKTRQLFGEKMPIVSEIVDEPISIVQANSKRATIYIIIAASSNKVLDVPNSAQEDGKTALIQYHYHGGLNQQWELVPVEENFFKIVSCLNGEVLDVWMHNREDGAEVVLCPYLGGSNQRWQLILIDNMSFTFKIVSQESNKVLDVWNDGKEDGTKVVVHHYLGGLNQHWRLIDVKQQTKELNAQLIMSLLRHTSDDTAEYLNKVRNRLGLPLTPALEAIPSRQGTTGWVQRFAGGSDDPQGTSVYSSKYGTYPTWGWIAQCYESCGGTNGRLGFPTSPELDALASSQGTTGQVQCFEDNASIYCSRYGAFPTWGGIGRCYENLGGSGGPLGFPTSSETNATPLPQGTDGWVQRFESGDIYWYWDGEYDGIPIKEPILSLFEKSGGSGGKFGFPKSPAISDPAHAGHYIQEFEGGVIQSFYQPPTR